VYSSGVAELMNPDIYAQIQNGTVINTIMAFSTDAFDPSYTWVVITNTPYCQDGISPVQIGCTYDGINFYAQSS
jgi:hypothetical protein